MKEPMLLYQLDVDQPIHVRNIRGKGGEPGLFKYLVLTRNGQ